MTEVMARCLARIVMQSRLSWPSCRVALACYGNRANSGVESPNSQCPSTTFHEPTDYHRFLLHRDVQCRIVVMVASKPSLGSGCCCCCWWWWWWWCCCCCCWNQAIPFLPASDTATNAFLLSSSTKCRGRDVSKEPQLRTSFQNLT